MLSIPRAIPHDAPDHPWSGPITIRNFATSPRRRLSAEERVKVWRQVWDEGDIPFLPEAERAGYRIACAWRLSRTLAGNRGLLANDEPLEAIPLERWHSPKAPTPATLGLVPASGPLPLCPRELPEHHENFGRMMDFLANAIGLHQGSSKCPYMGTVGMRGLTAETWPLPVQLIAFENSILEQVQEDIEKDAPRQVARQLRAQLGISIPEANGLVRMAINFGRDSLTPDLEENRFLMEQRLEDLIRRNREAGQSNEELKGLKVLAMVQGLTRTNPEGTLDEMVKVIDAVVREETNNPPQITVDVP